MTRKRFRSLFSGRKVNSPEEQGLVFDERPGYVTTLLPNGDGSYTVVEELVRSKRPNREPPKLRYDPLAFARFLVAKKDRDMLDLVRAELLEDLLELLANRHSRRFAYFVVWWRSLVNFAPFFWRAVCNLLPFKLIGWNLDSDTKRNSARQ